MSCVLASAVEQLLNDHQARLIALCGSDSQKISYQAQIHTLAGIARMFPDQSRLLQIMVSPQEGQRGSTVMTNVLEVGGAWFEFEGRVDQEDFMKQLREMASFDEDRDGPESGRASTESSAADRATSFNEVIKPHMTAKEHVSIQPYLAMHLPALVAKHGRAMMDEETMTGAGAASSPRL